MAKKKQGDSQILVEQAFERLPPKKVPEDRAAERFRQIAHLEKDLSKIRRRIADKKTELKTLNEQHEAVLDTLLEAARDEGDMPLPLGD